jgi:hypothetical protein
MDIALFVGFVRTVSTLVIPSELNQWLEERGWKKGPNARTEDVKSLLNVPVPITSMQQFEALFDWRNRTTNQNDGGTYLGAGVRSFFSQGGRMCYVVRVGDPWALEEKREARLTQLAELIPGFPAGFRFQASPADRSSWKGIGHLFGLPDVSLLVMPDLAEAVAKDRVRVTLPDPPKGPPEVFVECTPAAPSPPKDRTVRDVAVPVCDDSGFRNWTRALELVIEAIDRYAREVECVAAMPIPDGHSRFSAAPSFRFLQLAFPWPVTPGSDGLPGQVESPDGVLAGILARNALYQGTFRSAANLHLVDVSGIYPTLDRHQQQQDRLIERVSLLGPTPSGLRLLSDVTMSDDETYRPGNVTRLLATIVRTARRIGEDLTFRPSGEQLWSEIRSRMDAFMRGLYEVGILRGASAENAFEVRCDRSTMTQNDIDNGRVIAIVRFDAAAPVDTITVVLTVTDSGQTSAVKAEVAA